MSSLVGRCEVEEPVVEDLSQGGVRDGEKKEEHLMNYDTHPDDLSYFSMFHKPSVCWTRMLGHGSWEMYNT